MTLELIEVKLRISGALLTPAVTQLPGNSLDVGLVTVVHWLMKPSNLAD